MPCKQNRTTQTIQCGWNVMWTDRFDPKLGKSLWLFYINREKECKQTGRILSIKFLEHLSTSPNCWTAVINSRQTVRKKTLCTW